MDAASDRAPDPLAAWLAATNGGVAQAPPPPDAADVSPRLSRRAGVPRRLLLGAALPWVVVLALGAVALGRPAPSGSAPAPSAPATASLPTPEPTATGTEGAAPVANVPAQVLDHRLAAAAVLTLRLGAPDDQYIDTASAEQIDMVDGAAVVTVAAVVLDRVDGQWSQPRHVRFGVPLLLDQTEPVALSAPWVLPESARPRAEPETVDVEDISLTNAASQTLHAAGYRSITAPQLRRHTALPDILAVHVRARAPGEPRLRDHEIWLDAAASRVLGGPATPAPAQLPAPVPAEAP